MFSPLYDFIDICACTHPSSFHINSPKNNNFKLHFSRLGGHMAASSRHGRFSGFPGHYRLRNATYFLPSNFRHCMIIVSINYLLPLSLHCQLSRSQEFYCVLAHL